MQRPIKPGPLFVLTLMMLYPGLTLAYQGGYPFLSGEWLGLKNQLGSWANWGTALGLNPHVVPALKLALGLAWLGGVPGMWMGVEAAYFLTFAAAVGTVVYDPPKGTILGVVAAALLIFGRYKKGELVLT
jgi:hypothetical protein